MECSCESIQSRNLNKFHVISSMSWIQRHSTLTKLWKFLCNEVNVRFSIVLQPIDKSATIRWSWFLIMRIFDCNRDFHSYCLSLFSYRHCQFVHSILGTEHRALCARLCNNKSCQSQLFNPLWKLKDILFAANQCAVRNSEWTGGVCEPLLPKHHSTHSEKIINLSDNKP